MARTKHTARQVVGKALRKALATKANNPAKIKVKMAGKKLPKKRRFRPGSMHRL